MPANLYSWTRRALSEDGDDNLDAVHAITLSMTERSPLPRVWYVCVCVWWGRGGGICQGAWAVKAGEACWRAGRVMKN